ncbi:MAG TPA: hypothetical protein VHK69_10795 [Chitinophagaceae bacterium]|jgi:hypothetical protein|nr:hypothetical protein [Chitinophagaceae bacterium]
MHPSAPASRPLLPVILQAGWLAGLLDLLAALLTYYLMTGKNPAAVPLYIASGIAGRAAFSGGTGMVALGVLLHFVIAIASAGIFVFLYRSSAAVRRYWLLSGLVFGALVWAMMNGVVLPLSAAPAQPLTRTGLLTGLTTVILMVGLPVAWTAHRTLRTALSVS